MSFDVDAFLRGSALTPSSVYRRGEARLPRASPLGPTHESSGLNIELSDAPWSDLAAQVADAERFLITNREAVEQLAVYPSVSDVTLDFPIELRIGCDVAVQFERFPASLVRVAGALGISLEVSVYPPAAN